MLGGERSSKLTRLVREAGFMKLPHVKLQPDDGKHHDGEEKEQPDLKQGHHRLHDGLEDNLQACGDKEKHIISEGRKTRAWGWGQGRTEGLSKG